jgi:hypothetical protein
MYKNTHAVIRHDLNAFVEEAAQVDKLLFADKLLPVLPVESRAGIFPKIQIGNGGELLKADSTLRGPTGTYNETTRQFVTDTYECLDRGLEERIDDVVVRDYNKFFDVEVLTAKLITRSMKLDYEKRVYDLFTNLSGAAGVDRFLQAGHSGATYTGTGGAGTQTALADADYSLSFMNAIKELTKRGETPNTMIIGQNCWNHVRRTTRLNTFLYGSLGAGVGYKLVTEQDIAKHFGLQQVMIASAHHDTSKRNGAASLTPIWDNDTVWIGDVSGGEVSGGGAGRTFVWSKDGTGLYTTETYRSEPRRGDMVRVRHHTSEKMVNPNAGILIRYDNTTGKNTIVWN